MPKFACADFTFPVLERSTALKLVKLLGFDHVDLGLFARSSHFSPNDLLQSPRKYTAQALRDLDAASLHVSDVFVQIGVGPSDCAANDASQVVRDRNRAIFAHALELCIRLGCNHLTGLPGVFHSADSRNRDIELAAKEAAWRINECKGTGVQYAIEPHLGSICADVESTTAFLQVVNGLTLTLDYGHFISAGETSDQVHPLLPYASHVHVRGGAVGRLQTSVVDNTIDFTGMLRRLHGIGYDGFLALEYVWIDWNDCNRTDNVSETTLLRRALQSTISEWTAVEAATKQRHA